MTRSLVLFVKCLEPCGQYATTTHGVHVITMNNNDTTMSKSVLVDCLGVNQGLIEESTK